MILVFRALGFLGFRVRVEGSRVLGLRVFRVWGSQGLWGFRVWP